MGRRRWVIARAVGGVALPAALCCLLAARPAGAQVPAGAPSTAEAQAAALAAAQAKARAAEIDTVSLYLTRALAGPRDAAYLQVLSEALVVADPSDSSVFDLIARYDPDRYHSPYTGLYPLTFEEQFIQWGKRIALFTRSIRWKSGRFYLHDLATGEQAWIFTDEARRIYPRSPRTFPGPAATDNSNGQSQWLPLIHGIDAGTELEGMSLWLQLMRRESREEVLARTKPAAPQPAPGG